jgi:molecular chaperone DnaK
MVYQTEKLIKENDGKLPEDVKTTVQADVDALKTALAGEDIDAIKAANETLNESAMKLGEAIYAAASAEEPTEGEEATTNEDVVDAEVLDEEEDKKNG